MIGWKQIVALWIFATFLTQQILWAQDTSVPVQDPNTLQTVQIFTPVQPVQNVLPITETYSPPETQTTTIEFLQGESPLSVPTQSTIDPDVPGGEPPQSLVSESDSTVLISIDQTVPTSEPTQPVVTTSLEAGNQITPFTLSVSSPSSGTPNLTVAVSEDGTARVTYFSTIKMGVFNLETMSIEISFSSSSGTESWILKFKENDSQTGTPYLLDSFQRINSSSTGTYKFDDTSYFSENGRIDRVKYVETGISSVRYGRTFYGYDANGKHWITVTVEKTMYTDGRILNEAFYYITDLINKQTITANVNLQDDALFHSIQSAEQYQEIENAAYVKTISYYADPPEAPPFSFLYSIEFAKNDLGVFIPRRVNKMYGKVFIVRGEPDVLNGESDDILFQEGQMVDGYRIGFGPVTNLEGGLSQYGLIFSKKVIQNTSPITRSTSTAQTAGAVATSERYDVVAVVDFPSVNTVELEGVVYEIEIDQFGIVILSQRTEEARGQLLARTDAGFIVSDRPFPEAEPIPNSTSSVSIQQEPITQVTSQPVQPIVLSHEEGTLSGESVMIERPPLPEIFPAVERVEQNRPWRFFGGSAAVSFSTTVTSTSQEQSGPMNPHQKEGLTNNLIPQKSVAEIGVLAAQDLQRRLFLQSFIDSRSQTKVSPPVVFSSILPRSGGTKSEKDEKAKKGKSYFSGKGWNDSDGRPGFQSRFSDLILKAEGRTNSDWNIVLEGNEHDR